ncbi:MAG: P1 family peptidase [Pseudomonadota bacterium]
MGGRPGAHNAITDIAGVRVGSAHDAAAWTGVTAILTDAPMTAAADVRGGGPGTRETDVLDAAGGAPKVDGIILSGGSVYGLDAASAAVRWMGARGRGVKLIQREDAPPSPIVPSAILYDLANGGDKSWGETPPYAALSEAACAAAMEPEGVGAPAYGNEGAGYGAQAGALKGGLGGASFITEDGLAVGALIACNAFGSSIMEGSAAFWAWPYEIDGEFGGARPGDKPEDRQTGWPAPAADLPGDTKLKLLGPRAATTIGVVAVNVDLTPGEAKRVAIMAQDGLARALRPIHAAVDGDVLFTLANGERPLDGLGPNQPYALSRVGSIAADCVARACARAVYEATSLGAARSYKDVFCA